MRLAQITCPLLTIHVIIHSINYKRGDKYAKFIPFAKLSKKTQQEINKSHRKSWGNIDPVTKRPANSKAYNRKNSGLER